MSCVYRKRGQECRRRRNTNRRVKRTSRRWVEEQMRSRSGREPIAICFSRRDIHFFEHIARSNIDIAPRVKNMFWAQASSRIHIQVECQLGWKEVFEQFAPVVVSDTCYPPLIALVLTDTHQPPFWLQFSYKPKWFLASNFMLRLIFCSKLKTIAGCRTWQLLTILFAGW